MPFDSPVIFPHRHTRRVYCAGPLFNRSERREMEEISEILTRGGFEPFVPHADGMEFAQLRPYLVAQGHDGPRIGHLLHSAVFALDTYQVILGCGSLVFNMNGRVPDEGAVAECSMAWMLGKPVVLFKEDIRSFVTGRDNPLLVGQTGFETIRDIEALPEVLSARISQLEVDPEAPYPCPPHLLPVLEAGGRLWEELTRLGHAPPLECIAEVVLELFSHCLPVEAEQ